MCWCSSTLQDHLRIHSGEKPYKYTHCDKCFRRSSHLKRHLLIHTNERPFKCTQCEKCFRLSSHLQHHLRIHSGERPFQCTQCEKCFTRKQTLFYHKKNSILTHRTNVNHVVKISLMTMLWRGTIDCEKRSARDKERFTCRICDEYCYDHCEYLCHMYKHMQG